MIAVLLLSGCSHFETDKRADATNVRPWRILCVGDSITVGYTDNPSWGRPFEFGYRGDLFRLLKGSGIRFQFVGSSAEPWDGLWKVPTNQPSPDLRFEGQDRHEGYGAKTTGFVAANIAGWMQEHQPDFILLMIGINDIAAGRTDAPETALTSLRKIVETVIEIRPSTHLIVAQTIPYTRDTPAILQLNRFIREELIPEFAARGANVSTVDQCANFVSSPGSSRGDRALYSNGYNHPNAEGYRRMAQTWFREVERILRDKHSGAGVPAEGFKTHGRNTFIPEMRSILCPGLEQLSPSASFEGDRGSNRLAHFGSDSAFVLRAARTGSPARASWKPNFDLPSHS